MVAQAGWPDWDRVRYLVEKQHYVGGNEEFNAFHRKALAAEADDDETGLPKYVECAPLMWDFLTGFAACKPMYRKKLVQVFDRLLDDPGWSDAWDQLAPELSERVASLHEDLQAALKPRPPPVRVARTLSCSSGRSVRSLPGGIDARCEDASLSVEEEWREAKTPEGHTYYYGLRSRQATWDRPSALGGPTIFHSGDAVEIWSKSLKVWARGQVEKVADGVVQVSFALPGGKVGRKALPGQHHRDLRFLPSERHAPAQPTSVF
eukprot:TRINITY_DN21369_c0_g1_i1.p1 TRINITY_DN21369_c0_g1~~TRINITY_DN21369_c0_g1_i1.p1  ORF type:complete len:263 (-),score=47.76 TRINITY_DN21369_c0_g1_i1:188-976(-)